MKSILYLQKNLFYSLPVIAETVNGHLILTAKDGSIVFDAPGSTISAKVSKAWGIKLATTSGQKLSLYTNTSGFSPSPSKAQLEYVRNNTISTVYSQPDLAIVDSIQLIRDWKNALQDIHATIA